MGSSPCEHGYLPPLCDRCHVPVPGVTVTLSGNTSPGQGGGMPASVRELVEYANARIKMSAQQAIEFGKLIAAVEAHYANGVR